MKKPAPQSHLTLSDRITIEASLLTNHKARDIARQLKKDPTTISKEIKRRRTVRQPNYYGSSPEYMDTQPLCPRQTRFPYVCNGCPTNKRKACRKLKHFYRAKDAHMAYEYDLSDTRKGVNLTVEELIALDAFLTPLINRGQSFYHIHANNPDQLPYSLTTLYKYVEEGLFTFRNIDLPRKVRYKKRVKRLESYQPPQSKEGHSHHNYEEFRSNHPNLNVVQWDVVEGKKTDSKCLLTLFFVGQSIMLIRLLPAQQAKYVVGAFNKLEHKLGFKDFKKLFELSLTDNGTEFSDIESLEISSINGEKRINLFFCDPYRSDQKGELEKNHEFIRYVLPKGTSFDFLTPSLVHLLETHINSYSRKSLDNKTPYSLFEREYGVQLCRALSLHAVEANDVNLTPSLLK